MLKSDADLTSRSAGDNFENLKIWIFITENILAAYPWVQQWINPNRKWHKHVNSGVGVQRRDKRPSAPWKRKKNITQRKEKREFPSETDELVDFYANENITAT